MCFSQNGIHSIPINYSDDVTTYWNTHPYYPNGTNYSPTITSPVNTVSLSPLDDIQTTINSISTPTTIILNSGTYEGFDIINKSDIHIIGNGTVFIKTKTCNIAPTALAAADYGAYNTCLHNNDPNCVTPYLNPPTNIYFKNLIFDGDNTLNIAIWVNRAFDVVFDDCVFQNYIDLQSNHLGLIAGRMGSKNVWVRNCTFSGSQRYALYLDGCHGCGVMDSYIDEHFPSGGLLYLTNDDYSKDYNNNGVAENDEIKTAQFNVVYNNTFEGWIPTAVSIMGSNNLVFNNTVNHEVNTFAVLNSKASHVWQGLEYEYFGNKVIENTLLDDALLEFVWVDRFHYNTLPLGNNFYVGKYEVSCNIIQGNATLITETGNPIETPNTVEDNCVNDTNCQPCSVLSIENVNAFNLSVFPNPTVDDVIITFKSIPNNVTINVFNVNGKLLKQENLDIQNNVYKISFVDFSEGVYFLNIDYDGFHTFKRVIKL